MRTLFRGSLQSDFHEKIHQSTDSIYDWKVLQRFDRFARIDICEYIQNDVSIECTAQAIISIMNVTFDILI